MRKQLKSLYRKKTAYSKQCHEILANKILQISNHVIVEKMNYVALAKKSKETKKEEKESIIQTKKGELKTIYKYKRKKRFGKSIASRSPALLLTIIKRKCEQTQGSYQTIDTQVFKASQYNHETNEYVKVPLSTRSKQIENHWIQRDLYSAFLIWNTDDTFKHANREKCLSSFYNFSRMHDEYISWMKKQHQSMKSVFGF
ncbi:pXO1-20 [Lachnospiraceae bacterium TWA4]|nr:pXO1-20 [Lachnospiraceae bacterium TWA4]